MKIKEAFLIQNDCYVPGKQMVVKGIMVHSTATPGIMAEDWYSRWNKTGVTKCVNAFVDDTIVMQTLPWDMPSWHSGIGSLGKAKNANNTGYIGFEICEPAGHTYSGGRIKNYDAAKNAGYFTKAYTQAVELATYLCRTYNIPPEKPYLIDHHEGYLMGIASDHSDATEWFKQHGITMDMFRADVRTALNLPIYMGDETLMRTFRLVDAMNFRSAPNGTKLGVIPKGTLVTGSDTLLQNGVTWLKTTYDNKTGYVAVLPESKGYAIEVTTPNEEVSNAKEIYEKEIAELKSKVEKMEARFKAIEELCHDN